MSICELCWAPFENDDELAKHVEIEALIDWLVDALATDEDDSSRGGE